MVVVVSIAVVSALVVVLPLLHPPRPTRPPASPPRPPASPTPPCPSQALPAAARAHLGRVAWVQGGALRVVDLATCRQAALVGSEAGPPVRFSPDGRWVAFGDGRVVPAAGGAVRGPLGSPAQDWAWSPTADELLAGVSSKGGVAIAPPGGPARALLPDGSAARDLAFAPNGRRLAIARSGAGIQVLDVATGRAHTVLPEPDPRRVPEVAGWSPDGGWVLYWRGPVGDGGGPLDAVPASGGGWVNLWGHVLPYPDLLSPCGHAVAITAGTGTALSVGKQIFLSNPPAWRFGDLSNDPSRSWFWPACSPDGRWMAAVDTLSQPEQPDQTAPGPCGCSPPTAPPAGSSSRASRGP